MTNIKINSLNSSIYDRLSTVQLSRSERDEAVAALNDGEKIAEAILSVAHFLRQLFTTPALKPNFKH